MKVACMDGISGSFSFFILMEFDSCVEGIQFVAFIGLGVLHFMAALGTLDLTDVRHGIGIGRIG